MFKNSKTIATAGMLIALATVFSCQFPIDKNFQPSFMFLFIAVSGYLLGPATTMIVAVAADFLGLLLYQSGAYFPGFSLSALLEGLIFALFFYKANGKFFLRSLLAVLIATVFVYMLLNPLWLSFMYGKGFLAFFFLRLPSEIITFPFRVIILFITLKSLQRTGITKYYI